MQNTLDLCYTYPVDDRQIWRIWAEHLHRWGVDKLVATLLEAAGPLALLGAQIVYMGQPLLNPFVSDSHIEALARILEEPVEAQEFIDFLRVEVKGS